MSYLIDSFALFSAEYKVEVDINMNAVLNAPNIQIALTQMIKFSVFEDQLTVQISTNQMSSRFKTHSDSRLADQKLHIWSMIVRLWLVQCSFLALNSSKAELKIRASHLQEALAPQLLNQHKIPNYEKAELDELSGIYDPSLMATKGEAAYIARLLLDDKFVRFVT